MSKFCKKEHASPLKIIEKHANEPNINVLVGRTFDRWRYHLTPRAGPRVAKVFENNLQTSIDHRLHKFPVKLHLRCDKFIGGFEKVCLYY